MKLIGNVALLFGANVYIKATALLVLPLLVKNMSIEEFGVYSVAMNLLGYYAVIFSGGIKKIATIDTHGGVSNLKILDYYSGIRVVLLLLGWIVFSGFCYIYFDSIYRLQALTIISAGALYVFHSAWLKEISGDMKLIASALVVERTVFFVISLYGIYASDISYVFVAVPISIFCGAVYTQVKYPSFCFLKIGVGLDALKAAWRAILIGTSFLVATLNLTIDQLLVGAIFSDIELGMYAGISRLYIALLTFAWMFSQVFIPQVSKIATDTIKTRELIDAYLVRFIFGGIAVAIVGVLFSVQIIDFVLTSEFKNVNSVYLILIPMVVLAFANIVVCDSMDVYGFSGKRFRILLVAIFGNVIISLALGYRYGLAGVAFASVLSQVFIFSSSYIVVSEKYNLRTRGWAMFLPVVSVLFSGFIFGNI